MPSVLQAASSQPPAKRILLAHRAAQGEASSQSTQKYPRTRTVQQRPVPQLCGRGTQVLLSRHPNCTPAAASMNQAELSRMTKTQHLTPARRGGTRA